MNEVPALTSEILDDFYSQLTRESDGPIDGNYYLIVSGATARPYRIAIARREWRRKSKHAKRKWYNLKRSR